MTLAIRESIALRKQLPVDFGAFLQDQMRYERELVYQKLDENAYYYSASGGKPTEDDPVTIKDHIEEGSE